MSDGSIALWDMEADRLVGAPLQGHKGEVDQLAFSADGKLLVSHGIYEKTVRIWQLGSRQSVVLPVQGFTGQLLGLALSPDGSVLATINGEATATLWDVAGLRPLGEPLNGEIGVLFSVAFSPDGKTLAAGSIDGAIVVWDVSAESWQKRACQIAGRNLTQEEWDSYMGSQTYHKTCPDFPSLRTYRFEWSSP